MKGSNLKSAKSLISLRSKERRDIALEAILLLVFFFAFMHYGLGNLTDYRLDNRFPTNYAANDAFLYSAYSAYAVETDQVRTMPLFFTGGEKDIALFEPVLRIVGDAGLSFFSGIGPYDSAYVMLVFFALLTALGFYILLRQYKREVAFLSLPLCLMVFSFPFSIAFYWGMWSFVSGIMFFPALVFFIRCRKERFFIPVMIVLVAGQLFTYIRITPFIFLFIAGYYAYLLWKKRIRLWPELVRWGIIIAGSLVLVFYYLNLLNASYGALSSGSAQAYFGQTDPSQDTSIPVPLLVQLGLFSCAMIVLGIMFMFLTEKTEYSLVVPLYLLIITYLNQFLLGKSVFKLRLFWPIYLGGLLGFALYFLLDNLSRVAKALRGRVFYICLAISLALIIAYGSGYAGDIGNGLSFEDYNEGYAWLKANTSQDSRVLYFYGEYFLQSTYTVSERDSYFADMENSGSSVSSGNVSRRMRIFDNGYSDRILSRRLGSFAFETTDEQRFSSLPEEIRNDICRYDYLVLGKKGRGVLLEQNALYYAVLLDKGNPLVFENTAIRILRNEMRGECI
jgi:hypothetical protein